MGVFKWTLNRARLRRCGSGSTLRAAAELGRNAFGFEIDRNFYKAAQEKMLAGVRAKQDEDETQEALW